MARTGYPAIAPSDTVRYVACAHTLSPATEPAPLNPQVNTTADSNTVSSNSVTLWHTSPNPIYGVLRAETPDPNLLASETLHQSPNISNDYPIALSFLPATTNITISDVKPHRPGPQSIRTREYALAPLEGHPLHTLGKKKQRAGRDTYRIPAYHSKSLKFLQRPPVLEWKTPHENLLLLPGAKVNHVIFIQLCQRFLWATWCFSFSPFWLREEYYHLTGIILFLLFLLASFFLVTRIAEVCCCHVSLTEARLIL